ncbi:MAG: type pilus assembly protein PilA [Frankiales bacterium]|jgi:prepilin-type N-terminal cleavage/methylation domain-containing protein|nr:type pilus assembly protein PilA [Frankiales bacterium]
MRKFTLRSLHERDESGFTLIELLVVIIIIGILAAIAIPMFMNQKKRGYDASLKSDLRNAANAMETYYTSNDVYPVSLDGTVWSGNAVALDGEAVKLSGNNSITLKFNAAGDAYCLVGTNPKASRPTGFFYISSVGGIQPTGTTSCGTY